MGGVGGGGRGGGMAEGKEGRTSCRAAFSFRLIFR